MMQDKMKFNLIWYDEIRFRIKINMNSKHTIHIGKYCNLMGKLVIDPKIGLQSCGKSPSQMNG